MQNMKKDFCKEWFGKITKFFQMVFDLGYNYCKKNAEIDISKLDDIESSAIQAFQRFILKLNEESLSQVVHKLLKWANKSNEGEEILKSFNMHRQIILFKALTSLIVSLGEFAVPSLK